MYNITYFVYTKQCRRSVMGFVWWKRVWEYRFWDVRADLFEITLLGDGLILVYNGSNIYSYKCELDYISEMLEAIVDNVEGYDVSDENEYQETEIKVGIYNWLWWQ